ncbi:Fis family transcriptional regulator [Sphingobacteriales bacterium UPWRP_1]|nr:hypothetical protein BVG80_05170 [Sphingobacteriales bacterium TSM_CSM]PSJ76262.1 Fis family transcriptional regulator [Sphingobacteriales bacterium UPWRP_1]
MTVFTPEWIEALHHSINNNQNYRRLAAGWEGSLLLVMSNNGQIDETTAPAVWLNLLHGQCLAAKAATPHEFATADYILAGKGKDWKMVLDREIAPIMALMRGKLKLKKGSLVTLTRYAEAAKEIVNAAASLNAHVPDEWLQ